MKMEHGITKTMSLEQEVNQIKRCNGMSDVYWRPVMKKVITLFLICILIIFNTVSCGFDLNNKSETILEKTEKMAENVYDAIKNHDSEQLKEQFCERLQPGKETAVDKIYEYIDGEIETLETDFETDNYADTGGGENR